MRLRLTLNLALLFILLTGYSQDEGDALFNTDQVISVHLNFYSDNFWNELEDEYEGDQNYIIADVEITDITGMTVLDSVGVRLKGNSSYNHPGDKKSFKLDFNRFTSYDGQNFHGIKKLNFSNGFKDPSFMREKLFFDFCQEVGVLAPRANYAEVYMNEEYWGFYTIIEQVDDQFLDRFIEEDSGNLFKAGDNFGFGSDDAADLEYYGTNQSSYEDRYELKTNEEVNDWSDLISFIDFINNSSDEVIETELQNHLDLIPFLRSMVLDNMFSNLDAYIGSARNYYIYHNMDTDSWEWVKWDANEAFGMYGGMGLNLEQLDLDYHDSNRPLVEIIFENEVLNQMYLDEYCDIYQNYFSNDYLNPIIDDLKSLIDSYVLADDNAMYSYENFEDNIEDDIFIGGMGGGNALGLKSFIENKSNFLSSELNCTVTIDESMITELSIFPNPVKDVLILSHNCDEIQVEFFNMKGQIVYSKQGQISSIDCSAIENGLYMVHVQCDSKVRTYKILID